MKKQQSKAPIFVALASFAVLFILIAINTDSLTNQAGYAKFGVSCGNGKCSNMEERTGICPQDCGTPADDRCEAYTYSNCPASCVKTCTPSICVEDGPCTNDCDGPGSCLTKGRIYPEPREQPRCGNSRCEEGEATVCPVCFEEPCPAMPCTLGTCPQDCEERNFLR